MCNDWCLQLGHLLTPHLQPESKVLEVGSRIVNGSLREVLGQTFPNWTGIDIMEGPGVDLLLDSTRISEYFPFASFDAVISTEMLEHCHNWRRAILEMIRVLRPGGLLLLTTRSPGFELHEYPADYWRFTPADMEAIFQPVASTLALEDDMTLDFPCGVGIVVRKHDTYDDREFQKHLAAIHPSCVGDIPAAHLDLENTILFDQHSRLSMCAEILGRLAQPGESVLDVGCGPECLLGRYLTDLRITYLDPLIAESRFPSVHQLAGRLEDARVAGQQFDHVVAIDILEHISQAERDAFVRNLAGLARKSVILLFPTNTGAQALAVDNEINVTYRSVFGEDYPWLHEHLTSPLPDPDSCMHLLAEAGWHCANYGHGNTRMLTFLLPIILMLWEIPGTKLQARKISQDFSESLTPYDKCPPFYRTCLVASAKAPADLQDLFTIDCQDAAKKWQAFRERVDDILQEITFLSPFEPMPGTTATLSPQDITRRLVQQRYLLLQREKAWKRKYDRQHAALMHMSDWAADMQKELRWLHKIPGLGFGHRVYGTARRGIRPLANAVAKRLLPPKVLQRIEHLSHKKQLEEFCQSLKINNGKCILVFPIIPWAMRWQRPQQLLSRFAKEGYTILYLAMDLFPCGKKYKNYQSALGDIVISKLQDNVFNVILCTETKICLYESCLNGFDLSNALYGISSILKKFSIINPVYMVQFPSWYSLVQPLRGKFKGPLIFDCMDDHSGFFNTTETALEVEKDLLAAADLVLASSALLYERAKERNQHVLLVNNGTEFDHFHAPVPNGKLDHLRGAPIIGYYGAIAEWFDVELLVSCAKAKPQWHFVLIGATTGCETKTLAALPNVHLLGERPYAALPGYLAYFTVCTIPFKRIPLTLATNPVKFYEYLSCAKPVVSIALPELKPFADLCYLAENAAEFLDQLNAAVAEIPEASLVARRLELARNNTWDARAKSILDSGIFQNRSPQKPAHVDTLETLEDKRNVL